MSHITYVEISGLAGRTDTIQFTPNRSINVIFGLNGSGKSSLLKIIVAAMSRSTQTLSDISFKRAVIKIYSLDHKKEYTYTYDKTRRKEITDEEAELYELGIIKNRRRLLQSRSNNWTVTPELPQDVKTGQRIRHWNHRYLPTSRLYLSNYLSPSPASEQITEEALEEKFAEGMKILWANYHAKILQKIRQAQQGGLVRLLENTLSGKRSKARATNYTTDEAYTKTKSFLQREERLSKSLLGDKEDFAEQFTNNKQFKQVVSDLIEVETEIENAFKPIHDLQNIINRIFSSNKRVYLVEGLINVETSDNVKIGLQHLSAGEKHFLRLFVDNFLSESSSLIIDEPEISLHIDWQRELVGILKTLNPHSQLILATHSPEILSQVSDDCVFKI